MRARKPTWQLRDERCACCDGQGELLFLACTTCGTIVLGCGEIGTVFEIRDSRSGGHGLELIAGASGDAACFICGMGSYSSFRAATSEEIRACGFQPGDYC